MIRIKVAVKDPAKIPKERLVEMDRKLFWVSFKVEGDVSQDGDHGPEENPDDNGLEDDGTNEEKGEDTSKETGQNTPKQYTTDKESSKNKTGGTSTKQGHRTAPMWASLFNDNNSVAEGIENFNGFNLLRDMELMESEDDEQPMDTENSEVLSPVSIKCASKIDKLHSLTKWPVQN